MLTNLACPISRLEGFGLGSQCSTEIKPHTDSESWHRRLKRCFWMKIINEWVWNVQLFPKVWTLEISIKAFLISVSGSRLKAVLDIRIRLQTHYPAGYPTAKLDSDHLCYFAPLVTPLVWYFLTKCAAVKVTKPWISNHIFELRDHIYCALVWPCVQNAPQKTGEAHPAG